MGFVFKYLTEFGFSVDRVSLILFLNCGLSALCTSLNYVINFVVKFIYLKKNEVLVILF